MPRLAASLPLLRSSSSARSPGITVRRSCRTTRAAADGARNPAAPGAIRLPRLCQRSPPSGRSRRRPGGASGDLARQAPGRYRSQGRRTCRALGFQLVGGRLLPVNDNAGRAVHVRGRGRQAPDRSRRPQRGKRTTTSFRFANPPDRSKPSTGSTASSATPSPARSPATCCGKWPRNATSSFRRERTHARAADRWQAGSACHAASPRPPAASYAVRRQDLVRSRDAFADQQAAKARPPSNRNSRCRPRHGRACAACCRKRLGPLAPGKTRPRSCRCTVIAKASACQGSGKTGSPSADLGRPRRLASAATLHHSAQDSSPRHRCETVSVGSAPSPQISAPSKTTV